MKELRCIYDITSITSAPDITLYKRFEEITNLLPKAWQYPEIACAKIIINDREFRTENYRQTDWQQSKDIIVHGAKAGVVEVGYLEARPKVDEGSFSKEERLLIDAVAERLGIITQHRQSEEALRESEELTSSLLENSPNPVLVINTDTSVKYVNPAFEKLTDFTSAEVINRQALQHAVFRSPHPGEAKTRPAKSPATPGERHTESQTPQPGPLRIQRSLLS
ncbi:PAS domain S-box protein [Chloroflexota bacterium]